MCYSTALSDCFKRFSSVEDNNNNNNNNNNNTNNNNKMDRNI